MFNQKKVIRVILESMREGFAMDQESITIGTKEDLELVKWCLSSGYVCEPILERDVHQCICFFGRKMLEVCFKEKCSIDSVASPQALRYTLEYSNETIDSPRLAMMPAYYRRREDEDEQLKSSDLLYKVMKQLKEDTIEE